MLLPFLRLRYQYGGGVACGQQNDPPLSQEYHTAEWTFVPAKENGLTIGFLAWLSEVQPIGNNIRVIWFQQDGPTEWSSWAWTDIDKLEGARWVRDFIGDQQLLMDSMQLVNPDNLYLADPAFIQMAANDPSLLPTPVVDPHLMLNGCLAGDPTGQNIMNNGGNVNTQASGFVQTGCAMAHILSGWDLQPSIDPNHQENSYLVDILIAMAADANENVENIGNGLGNIWPCGCKYTPGTFIPKGAGTWFVYKRVLNDYGTTTCFHRRPGTMPYTATGREWPTLCIISCSGGSIKGNQYGTSTITPPNTLCASSPDPSTITFK